MHRVAREVLPIESQRPKCRRSSCRRLGSRALYLSSLALYFLLVPQFAKAFWLLGFATADTVPSGNFSAIAGTGGQYSSVGNPAQSSFTPFLPHAGLRVGLADGWDIGYRLTQVALPLSSAGPSLGGEIDVKHRFTSTDSDWQAAALVGAAYAYLDLSGQSKSAWSPGVDVILSRSISTRYAAVSEMRYVYTAVPTAMGGAEANHVSAAGIDLGMRIRITATLSVVPEVGVFNFAGRLADHSANGIAVQYGAVLAFRF